VEQEGRTQSEHYAPEKEGKKEKKKKKKKRKLGGSATGDAKNKCGEKNKFTPRDPRNSTKAMNETLNSMIGEKKGELM